MALTRTRISPVCWDAVPVLRWAVASGSEVQVGAAGV